MHCTPSIAGKLLLPDDNPSRPAQVPLPPMEVDDPTAVNPLRFVRRRIRAELAVWTYLLQFLLRIP